MNNNNVKNVNQNDNKTLMDAPVPSPTKDPTDKADKLEAETEVTTAAAVTATATAVVTSDAMSQQGSAAQAAPITTQSHNGSIAHSGQKPPSVAGTVKPPSLSQGGKPPSLSQGGKPPSLSQGGKPPSLSQGGKPPSLSQGQKPPSAHGSFTNQQPQTHTFQPTLPQLPEPLIPLSHPIDTKQEIVENYLNSLPPAGAQNGGMNLSNGSR